MCELTRRGRQAGSTPKGLNPKAGGHQASAEKPELGHEPMGGKGGLGFRV